MSGYTKLFSSIVASSIWSEPDATRIVWITMLAMANKDGLVEAAIPGLSALARVSPSDCERALSALSAPDKFSRSQEHEGRRIVYADGGWLILNHAKYRAKLSADERREYLTAKQREYRARDKSGAVNNGGQKSTLSTHTEADTEAKAEATTDTEAKEGKNNTPAPDGAVSFESFWAWWPGLREAKRKAEQKWARMNATDRRLAIEGLKKFMDRDPQFIPRPPAYLNGRRWEDEVAPSQPTRDQLAAGVGKAPEAGSRIKTGECSSCHQLFSAAHLAKHGGKCGGRGCEVEVK